MATFKKNTTFQTPIESVTTADISEYDGEPAIVFNLDTGLYNFYSSGQWLEVPAGSEGITNVQVIKSVSDLPDPVGDVITLDTDDITYRFIGLVDIGANRIEVTASNVKFIANNPSTDGIMSTTTGVLITSNNGANIDNLLLMAFSSSGILSVSGTGAETVTLVRTTLLGGTNQVDISNVDIAAISFCFLSNGVNGIRLFGSNTNLLIDRSIFRNISGTGVDLGTATFDSIGFDLCVCDNTATTTFLNVAPSSGNINTGGEGTITDCKINISAGGDASVGTSPDDSLWSYTGNNTITSSDRILPTGWEMATDGLGTTPTQAVSTTPVKMLVDSLGASSNTDYLPNSIRGISTLWDAVNSKISPMAIGDSYDLRVQVGITNLSGNPTEITLQLDIGGGVSPTIVIAEDAKAIKGLTQPIIFSFPIFTLNTFFANGGQIFLNTDTGTATIDTRSILIVRTSSGAS